MNVNERRCTRDQNNTGAGLVIDLLVSSRLTRVNLKLEYLLHPGAKLEASAMPKYMANWTRPLGSWSDNHFGRTTRILLFKSNQTKASKKLKTSLTLAPEFRVRIPASQYLLIIRGKRTANTCMIWHNALWAVLGQITWFLFPFSFFSSFSSACSFLFLLND